MRALSPSQDKTSETEPVDGTVVPAAASARLRPYLERNSSAVRWLLAIAVVYTLYFAQSLIIPIVVAAFIALFANPSINSLERYGVPRFLASVAMVIALIVFFTLLFTMLVNPAIRWADRFPTVMDDLTTSISEAKVSMNGEEALLKSKHETDREMEETQAQLKETTFLVIARNMIATFPIIIAQTLAVIFMVYFLLCHGNGLLLRFVQKLESFGEKRQLVEIVSSMQSKLSHYVLTITIINLLLGVCVGIAFYFYGVEDALLWGAMAGVLNFMPYLGPMLNTVIFSVVAYIQFDSFDQALIVPGIYLCLNLIECQVVTPTLLGRRLNLNPLIVFVWLVSWGWLWGPLGMLVGVPLLVCVSLYLEATEDKGLWATLLTNIDVSKH